MTEPTDDAYDVAVIVGSEKSDVPVVIASDMPQILGAFGLRWRLAAISAHRHAVPLREFCLQPYPDLYICAISLNPGLPGVVAGHTFRDACPVLAVALPNAEADPDGSKCLAAMCLQPPGVPVAVMGVGKIGLVNAAYMAGFILGIANPTLQAKVQQYVVSHIPPPNLNVKVPDTAA